MYYHLKKKFVLSSFMKPKVDAVKNFIKNSADNKKNLLKNLYALFTSVIRRYPGSRLRLAFGTLSC